MLIFIKLFLFCIFCILNVGVSNTKGVNISDGKSLLIEFIDAEGLLADWNRDHSDLEVKVHDKVVRVNGVSGDARCIADRFSADEHLEMTIQRNSQAMAPPWHHGTLAPRAPQNKMGEMPKRKS